MSIADRLLDAAILPSYDHSGYLRHAARFPPGELDARLDGQHFLVTGASSGIGLAVARGLAARGAEVWCGCRDLPRAERVFGELRPDSGPGALRALRLDVACLTSVSELPRALPGQLSGLVHNAGMLEDRQSLSPQGHDRTFATHVLGPHLLSHLLTPRLTGGRLCWVSSGGMYSQRLEAGPLIRPPEPFEGVTAYARAKRAQVELAPLWAERLAQAQISVSTMHPGWVATPGVSRSLPRFDRALRHRLRSPEEGADTVLFLMIAERARRGAGAPPGAFWFDREPAPAHLLPWTRGGDAPADLFAQLDRLVGIA